MTHVIAKSGGLKLAGGIGATSNIARSNPAATTLTDMYTVPAATQLNALINVCNRSAVATTLRISVAPAGAADNNDQYLDYDLVIAGNNSYERTIKAGPTDVVRVYATLATLTFVLHGELRT